MKRDVTSRIKGFDVHNDTVLSKQALFSLPLWLGENKLVTRWDSWQASSVASLPGRCAMLNEICNTPPHLDRSAYRNTRRSETRAVGEKMWRSLTLVPPSRQLHFFAAKKTIQSPSQDLVASYAEADDTLLIKIVFLRLIVECASQERDRSCSRSGSRINNIQTYSRRDDRYSKHFVCRARMQTVSKARARLIADGDPKKKENQPKPEKTQPEKPKPDRKGEKGSRRVKRPKV
jgi:hypothetical protein